MTPCSGQLIFGVAMQRDLGAGIHANQADLGVLSPDEA
jgi:hypothetical protein